MKKTFAFLASLVVLAVATTTYADDKKEKTISGEGQCAKCSLKQASSCQNAIVTEENGKKVTYLLEGNEVSKKFHKNICSSTEKVTATGTVKEEGGKKILTASKIELAK